LYHLTSRGSQRRPIVRDDDHRLKRLDWLRRTIENYGWRLHAFVLTTNHDRLSVSLGPSTIIWQSFESFGV